MSKYKVSSSPIGKLVAFENIIKSSIDLQGSSKYSKSLTEKAFENLLASFKDQARLISSLRTTLESFSLIDLHL